jgi:hypothetical protein
MDADEPTLTRPRPMFDSTDFMSCIRYRIAYGEAARLIEMARYDHAWGRDFAARTEKILSEVISRIGTHHLDVIKERVEDALEGRRPQW